MHSRTTAGPARTATSAATAAVLVTALLGGCGDAGTPDPVLPTASAPVSTSTPVPSGTPAAATDGQWGAYADRREACAAVADHLLATALLPANLSAGPTVERIQDVEDEVEAMLAAAPPEPARDLARVQLLVDSYGEALAEDPSASFDGQALDEALAPVRDWLDETCRDAG